MFFRFAGLSIEELYATKDQVRRKHLLASCRKLQQEPTDCLYPPSELLRLLIQGHAGNTTGSFDWTKVEVGCPECSQEIDAGTLVSDEELIDEHRKEHFAGLKQYRRMFADLRPKLEPVFDAHGEARPKTYRAFISGLEESDEKLTAGFGKMLYDKAAGTDIAKDAILKFYEECPPFRAFNYALMMSWFDLAVADEEGEAFESGRNDLFMSIYLPYCHIFVTAEIKAEQEKCLREIVDVAGLATEVLSYDAFRTKQFVE